MTNTAAAKEMQARSDKAAYTAAVREFGLNSPEATRAFARTLRTATLGRAGKGRRY